VLFTAHSHHRHFIDPRHISRTIHLWTAFHSDIAILFGQPSADFRALSNISRLCACEMHGAVLGQAFQGVTLSFHLSKYQFYETDIK
jgi:hypothetical protein